jgi:hypothetical protein
MHRVHIVCDLDSCRERALLENNIHAALEAVAEEHAYSHTGLDVLEDQQMMVDNHDHLAHIRNESDLQLRHLVQSEDSNNIARLADFLLCERRQHKQEGEEG